MSGNPAVSAVFGALMAVVAAHAAARILYAWRARRPDDWQVDGHHVLMGVSMAGMLIPSLHLTTGTAATTAVWTVVWTAVTVWFAADITRTTITAGWRAGHAGHHLPHLVMSAAMIYMLATPTGRAGMSGVAATPWTGAAYALLLFMAGYAVVTLDRIRPSHPGDRLLAPGMAAAANTAMAVTMGYALALML